MNKTNLLNLFCICQCFTWNSSFFLLINDRKFFSNTNQHGYKPLNLENKLFQCRSYGNSQGFCQSVNNIEWSNIITFNGVSLISYLVWNYSVKLCAPSVWKVQRKKNESYTQWKTCSDNYFNPFPAKGFPIVPWALIGQLRGSSFFSIPSTNKCIWATILQGFSSWINLDVDILFCSFFLH